MVFSLLKYVLAIELATEGSPSAFLMLALLLLAMDLHTGFEVALEIKMFYFFSTIGRTGAFIGLFNLLFNLCTYSIYPLAYLGLRAVLWDRFHPSTFTEKKMKFVEGKCDVHNDMAVLPDSKPSQRVYFWVGRSLDLEKTKIKFSRHSRPFS